MEAHKELGGDVEKTGWRTVDGKVKMIEEESCVKLRRTGRIIAGWKRRSDRQPAVNPQIGGKRSAR